LFPVPFVIVDVDVRWDQALQQRADEVPELVVEKRLRVDSK
jgi:hypothetical protein